MMALVPDVWLHRGALLSVLDASLRHGAGDRRRHIVVPVLRLHIDADIFVFLLTGEWQDSSHNGMCVGTIGFLACFWFVRVIYSSTKEELIAADLPEGELKSASAAEVTSIFATKATSYPKAISMCNNTVHSQVSPLLNFPR